MRWLQAAGAATLVIAADPVQAAEPRQPTARWVVDFDDAQCIASRNYGTSQEPLWLVLKAPPLGNVIQVGVLRTDRTSDAEQLDAELAFDQRPPIRASMLAFTANKKKERAYLINLPIEEFSPARTAKVLSIRSKNKLDESFSLAVIEPLMKIMDQCVADLRNVWNVTEPGMAHPRLKEHASGNLRGLIRPGDYPAVAINHDQTGTAALALLVDETGKVADCTVIGTSGVASLDAQACILLQERAKLKPAIGADGKPAKGSFLQRITWRINRRTQ